MANLPIFEFLSKTTTREITGNKDRGKIDRGLLTAPTATYDFPRLSLSLLSLLSTAYPDRRIHFNPKRFANIHSCPKSRPIAGTYGYEHRLLPTYDGRVVRRGV